MEVLLIAVVVAANIMCFLVGAKVGQKVSRGEQIKLPVAEPMEKYRNHQDKKEAQAKQERLAAILHNIDNYDGTDAGQKDIPGGE